MVDLSHLVITVNSPLPSATMPPHVTATITALTFPSSVTPHLFWTVIPPVFCHQLKSSKFYIAQDHKFASRGFTSCAVCCMTMPILRHSIWMRR